jgi:hypothetical protein
MKTPLCADDELRGESMGKRWRARLCCVGLLGRSRPISGHLAASSKLANRLAIIQEPFMNYPGWGNGGVCDRLGGSGPGVGLHPESGQELPALPVSGTLPLDGVKRREPAGSTMTG